LVIANPIWGWNSFEQQIDGETMKAESPNDLVASSPVRRYISISFSGLLLSLNFPRADKSRGLRACIQAL
jgi:hypothetical protein